jgi:plastocyanin
MKQYIYKLLLTLLIATLSFPVFSATVMIEVEDDEFSPAIFNVTVGDTIVWIWDEGLHTTTSTLIPAGAPAWDAVVDQSNPVYFYIVTVPGSYDYQCNYHFTMGMLGHFTVTGGSTDISKNTAPAPLISNTMISDVLKITFNSNPSDYNVEIMSLTGEIIKRFKPSFQTAPFTEAIIVEDLTAGIYIVNISGKNKVNSTRIIKM